MKADAQRAMIPAYGGVISLTVFLVIWHLVRGEGAFGPLVAGAAAILTIAGIDLGAQYLVKRRARRVEPS